VISLSIFGSTSFFIFSHPILLRRSKRAAGLASGSEGQATALPHISLSQNTPSVPFFFHQNAQFERLQTEVTITCRKTIKKAENGKSMHESTYAGETSIRVCLKTIKEVGREQKF